MNLEERYKTAAASTYVGKVRTTQAADAGAIKGVDFMDGMQKASPTAMDQVQDEFTRNVEGAFRYGGGGLAPASTNDKSYPLSRWLPAGRDKGDTYFTNNRYTTISDVKNSNKLVHRFSPLANKAFVDQALAVLSSDAKGRINGSASGPRPV